LKEKWILTRIIKLKNPERKWQSKLKLPECFFKEYHKHPYLNLTLLFHLQTLLPSHLNKLCSKVSNYCKTIFLNKPTRKLETNLKVESKDCRDIKTLIVFLVREVKVWSLEICFSMWEGSLLTVLDPIISLLLMKIWDWTFTQLEWNWLRQ